MFRWRDILILSSALMFAACDTKEADEDGDEDAEEEEETTPPSEYGPENSWWHALESDVPTELEGTGYDQGDIAYNFQLNDQFGEEVQMYQFYGQVIVLDVFAEW